MPINFAEYKNLVQGFANKHVTLVAVSKTRSQAEIIELYEAGQRDFGENYVQELVSKASQLPSDIRWHFIGHLQSNKVKHVVPIVQLIHGVDSLKLLKEINKEAGKIRRVINCLLQVHIASEETKFGLDVKECETVINESSSLVSVKIRGLMGMASMTDDLSLAAKEFSGLKMLFDQLLAIKPEMDILSMGMSGDYRVAIERGSTMVRIGTLLFGEREKRAQSDPDK